MTGTDVATYMRERPGMSTFVLEDGVVYHTYSTYARGLDGLWGMYQWLDRAPKGRNEEISSSGGSAVTSTTSAEEANEAEVKMRDLIVAVKISVEDNIDGDIGGIKCPSEGRRHERRRHKR